MASNADIAAEWRELVDPDFGWRLASNQAGTLGAIAQGEGGGRMVTCDRLRGRRAYLKPLRIDRSEGFQRATREKIASDLAFDLGVPVPPVLLWRRQPRPEGEEEFVCVSLVMFPRQASWASARVRVETPPASAIARVMMPTLPERAAQALAFDTWVDQWDHGDRNPHNIICGFDPSAPDAGGLLFLDYAFALGFGNRWRDGVLSPGGYSNCERVQFPGKLLARIDRAALDAAVSAIEQYPEESIEHTVTRIPSTHLHEPCKALIVEGLSHRRELVRDALADYL